MKQSDLTFALDIGTRSVVGLILKEENGTYHIIDSVIKEHQKRSMLDGQIHDVLSVASVITAIKEELEKVHGRLHKVCVAAAGRALKTERASSTFNIKGKPMFQKEDILQLELMALQTAQKQIADLTDTERAHHYDCVGYSVLQYMLDGEEIGSLIDQQGNQASVEIIATFLPKVVVESLLAALNRADLEMDGLTLEPIAAINVLIPPSMRRLNVALVDIGAGTSDIAITDLGTIISYGMVPVAGDEITEAFSDEFLLDFPKAEEAKRKITTNETITVSDILGFETEITSEEAIEKISNAIDKLANSIKDEIIKLNNGRSPKAVMLVGGGSLTPELPKRLAACLQLPNNRVAIRGIDAIENLQLADHMKKGPELVTPIGIAVASKQNPIQYISAKVNDRAVRLFQMKSLTVGDCILASGLQLHKYFGKPGLALMVNVNGNAITIPGEQGYPPIIKKNNKHVSIEDEIHHGDIITIEKGQDGKSNQPTLASIVDIVPTKTVTVNGQSYSVNPTFTINQQPVKDLDILINDRDNITCSIPNTIEELLQEIQFTVSLANLKPFSIEIDGKVHHLQTFSATLNKNGLPTTKDAKLEDGDVLFVHETKAPTLNELINETTFTVSQSIPVIFNGESITLERPVTEFFRNGDKLELTSMIKNGDKLTTTQKEIQPFIYQDIFTVIDIDIPSSGNNQFQLLKNGEQSNFQDPLAPGDELSFKWL
ncbi:cell division protein FtsA [Metabacillus malikii]|uniref:Cell division protein FtsA n=1 Tax=Metabacillus malikii TaxID=1504265 RepID=A0ABT9ZFN4_9BACI|nr:cell division protein FtsA [Metabacillus malikii]MDQ0231077.1 cell division protein FtsA [Metabacillus malikii]